MAAKMPKCVAKRIAYLDIEISDSKDRLQSLKTRFERARGDAQRGDQGAAEEVARLQGKRTQVLGRLDALARLRNGIDEWLGAAVNRGMPLQEFSRNYKIPQGAALKDAIETIRSEIMQAKAELADVKRAPTRIESLRKQVTAHVLALAKQGAPMSISTDNGLLRIDWLSMGGPVAPHKYLAWMDPNAMIERLIDEIEERQSHSGRKPLTPGEKQARIEELSAIIEKAERKEVALVDAAIDAEITGIEHRADISIPVFLGVQPVQSALLTA